MKLKINESKTFKFEMNLAGVSWDQLKGYFRLMLENVEYGFPVKIEENLIEVNIPVFKDLLHEGIRSSLYKHKEIVVEARLDLIANDEVYIRPWKGKIEIDIPVSVKLTEQKSSIKEKFISIDPIEEKESNIFDKINVNEKKEKKKIKKSIISKVFD